jgi:hypothetical protein
MTDDGTPTEVARFEPKTPDEIRRWKDAERRRDLRNAARLDG